MGVENRSWGLRAEVEGPVGPSRLDAKAGLLEWAREGTVNSGCAECRLDLRTAFGNCDWRLKFYLIQWDKSSVMCCSCKCRHLNCV